MPRGFDLMVIFILIVINIFSLFCIVPRPKLHRFGILSLCMCLLLFISRVLRMIDTCRASDGGLQPYSRLSGFDII